MEIFWIWISVATLLASYVFLNKTVRRLNEWYYNLKLGKKLCLPPGDMGWPFIGNLIPFVKDLCSGHLDSFINNLVSKYGRTGIYKTHLFGKPSIIVCTPEMCRQVLTDEENFKSSYPKSFVELYASKFFSDDVSNTEHKRLRRLIIAPITGHNVLATYIERIEEIVINLLEELSSMKHPVVLFKELEKVPLEVIIHIVMGTHNPSTIAKLKDLFIELLNCNPLFCVAINFPGFAFHKALKVRKKLFKLILSAVDEKRLMIKNGQIEDKKYIIDILLEAKGENGEKFEDKDIADVLIMFLSAGHESTAISLMWSVMYLTQHPDVLTKAKEEQEEIVKARPSSQKHLSHKEIKQMVYLSQVIDEMLRRNSFAFTVFRESTVDININGYMIPKGWKILVWLRAIHMNPEYYPNPEEFNPSRWDNYNPKLGTFLPFGVGSKLCPGKDLSRLELSIFLHYFLLHYKLEEINPECPVPEFLYSCPKNLAKVVKVSMVK